MAHVNVTVNGRKYKMGCREGEQRRVSDLAEQIDSVVQMLKGSAKAVPDDRLFLMAAIVMADELADVREELQHAVKTMADFRAYQVIEGNTAATHQQNATRGADSAQKREPAIKRDVVIKRAIAT